MLRFYRALTTISDGRRDYQPGQSIPLTDEDAAVLLEAGYIEPLMASEDDGAPTGDGGHAAPVSSLPDAPPTKNDTVSFLDSNANSGSHLTDLNTATLSDLISLPRIGEATANKLIAARPLASLEDARKVAGMSEARWADVVPLLNPLPSLPL